MESVPSSGVIHLHCLERRGQSLAVTQAIATPIQPAAVGPRQRLDSLDLLRGVGILGILLMNTQSMSMPAAAYFNPTDYGNQSPVNFWTWVIVHIVADMKFITIFSTMFGAGINLQAERSALRGLSPAGVHYRRMAILILFGLAHAYLLWFGDILVIYCLSGMILYPLRRLRPGLLVAMGVVLVATSTFVLYAEKQEVFEPVLKLEAMSNKLLIGVDGTYFELQAYRNGWAAEMHNRPWFSLDNETSSFLLDWFWRCGGCMLIGMGLHKSRFFHGTWPKPAYAALAAFAIPVGSMITIVGVIYNNTNGWDDNDMWFMGFQFNYWGSLVAAMGYMALGALVAIWAAENARGFLAKAVVPIRAVGRTALSNYIMQSVICTTIFYGHGFGEYGYVSRIGLVGITVAIWIFQLIVSTLWTRRFRQGPLEWLWHRAVYFDAKPD